MKSEMILKKTNIQGFGKRRSGKVRDSYTDSNRMILITTDRISAFDVVLGYIPQKGQVLNLLSQFWFENTVDIIENHMISVPHPNVMVVKKAEQIPIEMVVRGYITGVTNTSIWGSYAKGERKIYGIQFPDGLIKNQKLKKPVITPTTKPESGHDERLERDDIISKKIVPEEIYKQIENVSLELFKRGQKIASRNGLILVDTKYEFGLIDGKLVLIDEIHTPDSSRFWIKKTYSKKFKEGLEPDNFDKEFLRLWYKERGYTGDGTPPVMTSDFVQQVSTRYVEIYEMLTNKKFVFDMSCDNESIQKVLNTL